jgi:hypothetical protein
MLKGSCMGSSESSEDTYCRELEEHYARHWSVPLERIRLTVGSMGDLPPDFAVLFMQRTSDMMAYATVGMSQLQDDDRLELHILSRPAKRARLEVVEILTAVAHYHRTGQALGIGHTVNFGRPWLPGSVCTYGLISLPYLDGPDLEWLRLRDVRFLWLIPVTEAEVQFKKQHGLDALEQRFEAAGFDYLDPDRRSVV